jgi:NAD-dependent deacetylase
MRPHVLFFDEAYNEEFYYKETVLKLSQESDILFVVGTMLETNLA